MSSEPRAPAIEIDTVLAIDELESGRVVARAVADPSKAAVGEEQDALLEQKLFLAEHLRRSGAAAQARFSLPPDVELVEVDVDIEPPGLRERDRRTPMKMAMPCAVLPEGRARWALVIPLGLTVYVAPGEDLAAIVAEQAARHVGVWAPEPWDVLGLFPGRSASLVRLTVEVERDAAARTADLRRRIDVAQKRKLARAVLASVSRAIRAADVAAVEPVGLEEPLATLDALLAGDERRSVLIVGEERVGKSELAHAWLRKDAERALYATSGAQLVAGMSGLGQWQERVRRVMEAAETLDAILYFDDLRDLFGDRPDGHVDLPSAIKPWLEEGRVRVVGELTPEAADLFATRQAGLFAHLAPVRVEPQDARAAHEALARHGDHAQKREPHRPQIDAAAVAAIVELTDRYLPYRPFPGKAVRLYHELRSSYERAHRGGQAVLGANDVYELFSLQSGIPTFLLRDDVEWRTERARELFARRLVGQREAIALVVDALCMVKAGLAPRGKPLASFLFCGPTGVGKTELARALAELLFGHADRLVRFDMSELADPMAAERLIRGSESEDGELTAKVRQQPFCVVLLDEIEKAHPSVFDLLLQVLGEGRLTDARGRTAYFHDAIVVMTSNLGTQHRSRRIGLAPPAEDERGRVVAAVEASFRPELINRLDRIVLFHPLDRAQIREVAEHLVSAVAMRRGAIEQSLAIEVSDAALDVLAEGGFAEAYGARALRRHLEDELAAPIARLLGKLGRRARGSRIRCRTLDEPPPLGHRLAAIDRRAIAIDVVQGDQRAGARDSTDLFRVASLRRWAHEKLSLPTMEEVRARVGYLTAELAYGPKSKRKKPEEIGDAAAQSQELRRLQTALARFDEARAQLDDVEELAMAAYLSGEASHVLGEEADLAHSAVREGLLGVLLAPVPRHRIALVVQEHDRLRPLDAWLGGLLDRGAAARWQIAAHLYASGGYGPAIDAAALRAKLFAEARLPLTLVLRVQGEDVGTLLALEGGLHRWYRPSAEAELTTFAVRSIAQRFDVSEKELASPRAAPPAIPKPAELRLLDAVREVGGQGQPAELARVAIAARRATLAIPRDRYWQDFLTIALEHLLLLEDRAEERAALFASPLDAPGAP